jgi:hypothetical protein
MAIGTPTLPTPVVGTAGTTATTASFTPTANAVLFALGGSRQALGVVPTISDSLGGTWTPVNNAGLETGNINGSVHYQVVSGSPSAMTVTATSTGASQTAIGIVQVTGINTDFSNYQEDTDTAGDPSLTLSAYASGSGALGFAVGNAGGSGFTQPSGFTELNDTSPVTNLRFNICYDITSPGTALSWTGVSTDTVAFGFEIKEAATGGINGSAAVAFTTAGSLQGAGALAGSSLPTFSTAGTLSATLFITGTSNLAFTTAANIGALVPITGSTSFAFTTSATGTQTGALAGTVALTFGSDTANLLGVGRMFGSVFPIFDVTGTMNAGGAVAGTSAVAFTTSGTLRGTANAVGTAALTFTTAGELDIPTDLFGGVITSFTTAGSLKGVGRLTGTSSVAFGTSASGAAIYFLTGVSTNVFETSGSVYEIRSPYGFTFGTSSEIIYEVN